MPNNSVSRLEGVFEAWRQCDNAYVQLLRQWGLSLNTVWALEYLVRCPNGVEPAVLAEDTHMLRQTITVVLNDLENRGYIQRVFHRTDHRKKVIHLTAEGKVFASRVLRAISDAEQEAVSALTAEEQQRLLDYSRRFSQEFVRKVSDITSGKKEDSIR